MIRKNISLKPYNTFGLDCRADTFIPMGSEIEAINFIKSGKAQGKPLMILGGGSNVLFLSDFNGVILHSEIKGIEFKGESKDNVIVSAGAGVIWDALVEWAVENGYGGIENLSLIPGTVGAVPVQNIGAYGVECGDLIHSVRAVSLETGDVKEFNSAECRFGYRDSIFKKELKNSFIISRVEFRLSAKPEFITEYGSLKEEAEKLGPLSLKTIREAVIKIRRSKLPDPEKTGNAGSFFKNPVVSRETADKLKEKYPPIPHYSDASGGTKLSAGWLIEKCGWKGRKIGDAGVHDKQALVLVNHGNATGMEIYNLSEMIRESVLEEFGIDLRREVELIGI